MRQTSIESYKRLFPTLNDRQQIVYDKLVECPDSTNRELAKLLCWEINCVTPRVTELVDSGMVRSNGTKRDVETNRSVTCWEAI